MAITLKCPYCKELVVFPPQRLESENKNKIPELGGHAELFFSNCPQCNRLVLFKNSYTNDNILLWGDMIYPENRVPQRKLSDILKLSK
jgi:endogenous inhibitor of DNA gyrase (YacG/DUF329 family)